MDREAWSAAVHGSLATHSGNLAWKIPWTEEPGRLQSIELQRVGHTCTQFSSVQFSRSVVSDSPPWTAACQASLSITSSQSLPKLMSIESVMPSNHLILCHPLLLLPSIFPSIRVFPNESALSIRWPKYWSLGFSISPSNENSELISFRIDWFDLLAVQGTVKSSPTTQFESIYSLALSLLYGPTLTSVHD